MEFSDWHHGKGKFAEYLVTLVGVLQVPGLQVLAVEQLKLRPPPNWSSFLGRHLSIHTLEVSWMPLLHAQAIIATLGPSKQVEDVGSTRTMCPSGKDSETEPSFPSDYLVLPMLKRVCLEGIPFKTRSKKFPRSPTLSSTVQDMLIHRCNYNAPLELLEFKECCDGLDIYCLTLLERVAGATCMDWDSDLGCSLYSIDESSQMTGSETEDEQGDNEDGDEDDEDDSGGESV